MPKSTLPLWRESATLPASGHQLNDDVHCDVCVIGGGIAGLSVAYHLLREQKTVVVLEAQSEIGAGETSCSTAHLSSIFDDHFAKLESIRGLDAVRAAYRSHAAAIDTIEEIQRREGIDCDFQRLNGYLFAPDAKGEEILREETQTCKKAGIRFEWFDDLPIAGSRSGPAMQFPEQAQFDPRKYLIGLAGAVQTRGAKIHTNCRVDHVEPGEPLHVITSEGRTVTAKSVVLATNTPINSGIGISAKLAAYSTYVIAAEVPIAKAPHGLFWDTEDPYHYVRFHIAENNQAYAIIGGEDHKTGQEPNPAARYDALETWARSRFPQLGSVRHRWDGQVFETLDGLAMIGADASTGKGVYVVTGDSGMGLTHGTLAGSLIADAIMERKNDWAELYDPARLSIQTTGTMLRENANTAGQYLDWLTSGDNGDPLALAEGEGMIVRKGLSKLAICRVHGESGLTVLSATCPHFGAIVRWNNADQTWDCPCHGSRFNADGRVLHGPATTDLKPVAVGSEIPAQLSAK